MFCTKCGQQLPDGAKFCTSCGAPLESAAVSAEPVQEPASDQNTAARNSRDYVPPTQPVQPPVQQPVQPPVQQPVMIAEVKNQGSPAIPIIALIFGLLSMFFFWLPFLDVVLALLAVIFGGIGLRKRLKGMAIAALVIGIVFLIVSIIWTILAVAGAAFLESNPAAYHEFYEIYDEIFKDALRDSGYYYR